MSAINAAQTRTIRNDASIANLHEKVFSIALAEGSRLIDMAGDDFGF